MQRRGFLFSLFSLIGLGSLIEMRSKRKLVWFSDPRSELHNMIIDGVINSWIGPVLVLKDSKEISHHICRISIYDDQTVDLDRYVIPYVLDETKTGVKRYRETVSRDRIEIWQQRQLI